MANVTFHELEDWIKQHPYETAGAVFVGGAVLIYMYYSHSAAAPAAAPSVSVAGAGAGYGAYLQSMLAQEQAANQAAAQSQMLQDQLAAQTASINGAVSVASMKYNTDLQLASIGATTTQDSIAALAGIQKQQISSNLITNLQSITAQNYANSLDYTKFVDQNYTTAWMTANNNQTQLAEFNTQAGITNALINKLVPAGGGVPTVKGAGG